MFDSQRDWYPVQERLKKLLVKPACFDKAKDLVLHLHALLHVPEVSNSPAPILPTLPTLPTLMDEIWEGLREEDFLFKTRARTALEPELAETAPESEPAQTALSGFPAPA